jgi:hypothetical protein
MTEGWIPESATRVTIGFTMPVVWKAFWIPGRPEHNDKGEVKWEKGMEQGALGITAYRCNRCGYVEIYAKQE